MKTQNKKPVAPPKVKNGKCYTCKKLPVIKTDESNLQAQNVNTNSKNPKQQIQNQNIRPKLATSTPLKSNKKNENEDKTTTITTTLLNPTYTSASRCVSAKIQVPNQQLPIASTSRVNLSSAKTNKSVIDVVDFTKNNYNNEYSIDKEILDEDDINVRKNLIVNKEEQLRKMNILPGKTFRSQRRKSISVDHVPVSKKKIETQKARIPLTVQKQTPPLTRHKQLKKQQVNNFTSKSSPHLDPSTKKI